MISRAILIVPLYLFGFSNLVHAFSGDYLAVGTTPVSEKREIGVQSEEGNPLMIKKTPVLKADFFCHDGMVFMSEGLREEAVYNFKIATELYKEALRDNVMIKEELLAIRENLKQMSWQLGDLTKSGDETVKAMEIAEKKVQELPIEKTPGQVEKEELSPTLQPPPPAPSHESTVQIDQFSPTLQPETTPSVKKSAFREAKEGEYWVIDTTTMLLKTPEFPESPMQLVRNLVVGIKPGTPVRILETQGTVTIWIKIYMYDDKNRTEGWVLSDTVGKARQIDKTGLSGK